MWSVVFPVRKSSRQRKLSERAKSLSLSLEGKQLVFYGVRRKRGKRAQQRGENTKTRAVVGSLTRWRQSSWGFTSASLSWVIFRTQKPHTEWFNNFFFRLVFLRKQHTNRHSRWNKKKPKWWIWSHQDDTSLCCLIIWHLVLSSRVKLVERKKANIMQCWRGASDGEPIYHSQ